jgi:hypothetical protein
VLLDSLRRSREVSRTLGQLRVAGRECAFEFTFARQWSGGRD